MRQEVARKTVPLDNLEEKALVSLAKVRALWTCAILEDFWKCYKISVSMVLYLFPIWKYLRALYCA